MTWRMTGALTLSIDFLEVGALHNLPCTCTLKIELPGHSSQVAY